MTTAYDIRLDNQGEGRFEVFKGNVRIGIILGGAGCWVAEPSFCRPSKKFPTKKDASSWLASLELV